MPRAISITEPLDLSAFRRPMQLIPARVEAAIAKGVLQGPDLPFSGAARLLDHGADGVTDAVIRNSDGMLVVCCLTDMPGNTPQMWDWWFGWHSISSERYKLWHPEDHVAAAVSEDRRARPDLRDRYIGIDSYVDERIASPEVLKLTISFRRPASFGLDEAKLDTLGTAICARVGFRGSPLNTGRLIHLIRRTATGAEMLSRFWLGDIEAQIPLIGGVLTPLLNTCSRRLQLLPDQTGLNLLRHCAKEMNHLASILPELHAKFAT
jgi:DAPG hydrolase PhiG domain